MKVPSVTSLLFTAVTKQKMKTLFLLFFPLPVRGAFAIYQPFLHFFEVAKRITKPGMARDEVEDLLQLVWLDGADSKI